MGGFDGSGHRRSSGTSVVVSEQSAEAFAAVDDAGRLADFIAGIDELVHQSLMISLGVIVRLELGKGLSQWCLAGNPAV